MIFTDQEDGFPQWVGILNPLDGSLISKYKLEDSSGNRREIRLTEDSVILTATHILLGM